MPTGGTVNWEDYITTANLTDLYTTYQNDPLGEAHTYTNTTLNDAIRYDCTSISFVTTKDLDEFAHRLYKIIEEHTPIDISEDEFMELIKDDR